jgi:NADH:ubiquinone oxidoreductase subunit 4 (subunit M)
MIAAMMVGLLWLGLYPQPVLNTFEPALDNLRHEAQQQQAQIPATALRR